ncbi:MAG: hypothetical protein DWQ10_06250 [Calditrichaeota bacterium]|nr:MAG: hypothetical protein DWQ10_06250 [Calditrichota bacterium]
MQPAQQINQPDFNFRDIKRILKTRIRLILIIFIGIIGLIVLMSMKMQKIYQANARLLLKWDKKDAIILQGSGRPGAEQPHKWQINSEVELIRSYQVAERVSRFLNKSSNSTSQQDNKKITWLMENIIVAPVNNSDIIEVAFEHTRPVRAAQIVSFFIKAYTNFRQELYEIADENEFLNDQIARSKNKLKILRKDYNDYLAQKDIVSLSEQKKQVLNQFHSVEQDLFTLERKCTLQETLIQQFQLIRDGSADLGGLPVRASQNANWGNVQKLYNQLTELRLQKIKLLNDFTEEYEQVKAVESNISYIRALLQKEVDRVLEIEKATLNAFSAEKKILQAKYGVLKKQLRNLPEIEQKHEALFRDVNEYENLYSILVKRKEEDTLNAFKNMNPVKIEILNPPLVPTEPIRPNVRYNAIIAIIIGLFVSLGTAFLMEFSDPTVKNAESLEKTTGLPVLAEVQFLQQESRPLQQD